MSNQTNSFSSPINEDIIQNIDQLDLPVIQKQHIRLLAHCLEILKEISVGEMSSFDADEALREWCEKQTKKFNDKNFNELLYEQMSAAAQKLNSFSLGQEKNFKELNVQDLICLVKENSEN